MNIIISVEDFTFMLKMKYNLNQIQYLKHLLSLQTVMNMQSPSPHKRRILSAEKHRMLASFVFTHPNDTMF